MGRKLDQIKLGDSSDRLHYVVNPAPPGAAAGGGAVGGAASEGDLLLAKHVRPVSPSSSEVAHRDGARQETIEFLVVNDDLILQRRAHAVSQPDLAIMGESE